MRQVLQNLSDGKSSVDDYPMPCNSPGNLLIETSCSLISPGTEKMLVEFANASLIGKVKQQPDKVKQVMDKVSSNGLLTTIEAVRSKLNQPLPLGYSNVGKVLEVGKSVCGFKVGDRVVSNGCHSEIVTVGQNLCAKIPDSVSDEAASFTVLSAIGLQGIRLASPTLGETFGVIGLGVIGLITVQILRANGCRVICADFNRERVELARKYGAHSICLSDGMDFVKEATQYTNNQGLDGVLITAATKSSDPVHQAALSCRKRGRVVLVGVTGLNLSRDDFYKKEISFQVSCSYGPGRYEGNYEGKGLDYPIGFVRWTEQRNFEAVLNMMAEGKIDTSDLITHKFDISDAEKAYSSLQDDSSMLTGIFYYPKREEKFSKSLSLAENSLKDTASSFVVSAIGAGNYATRFLLPAFKNAGARFTSIACKHGVSGTLVGKKLGFSNVTTEEESVYTDGSDVIVIATRHDLHARQILKSLKSNKHVFVEKPLAITLEDIESIKEAYEGSNKLLMVGFNRRFAPQVQKIKKLLSTDSSAKNISISVNAGHIPEDHWVQDLNVGGGRIIGEVCHFIDLARFLVGNEISTYSIYYMGNSICQDTATITLGFADGSIATINYYANGNNKIPKERVEVHSSGKYLLLDNFVKLKGYGWPGFSKMNLWKQDKGQDEMTKAFASAIKSSGKQPIPFNEIYEVSKISILLGKEHDS